LENTCKTFQCNCEECLCSSHIDHKGAHTEHHEKMVNDFKKRFWVSLAFTLPILIFSPMVQLFFGFSLLDFKYERVILFIVSSIVFFYGGWPFLKGFFNEVKTRSLGMMTLIALAIVVAYVYSSAISFGLKGKPFFWELATLIDIMLLGHWIEMRSIMGAGKALEELAKLMPSVAHKIMSDKSVQDIPVSELKIDDLVLVKPGEKIPADGEITEGESDINEAMLTGESKPVRKSQKDSVIGGSINGESSFTLQVKKIGKDSYLSQVIDLVKSAQSSKSKAQSLANRAAFWLTIVALSGGILTIAIWLFLTSEPFSFAMERAVTVMVITCPHALGLAVPLVVAVSTSIAAKKGLLIRNRTSFEEARKISAIVFDKTGTLTRGKFGITDTITFDGNEEEILNLAAAVESHSEHPIAQAIASSNKKNIDIQNFKAIPGKGAEATVQGKSVKVVSPGYLKENNIDFDYQKIEKLSNQGKTVVFVLVDDHLKGAIALADIIRDESKEAVKN